MQNNMNNFLMNEPLKMSDHSSADNSDDYLFYKKRFNEQFPTFPIKKYSIELGIYNRFPWNFVKQKPILYFLRFRFTNLL